eukprot:scaffold41890_cov78-Phaeocystis_antarctica.AAC.1
MCIARGAVHVQLRHSRTTPSAPAEANTAAAAADTLCAEAGGAATAHTVSAAAHEVCPSPPPSAVTCRSAATSHVTRWPSAPAEARPPPDSAQSACSPPCPRVGRRVARSDGRGVRPSSSPLDHSSSPPSALAEASRLEAAAPGPPAHASALTAAVCAWQTEVRQAEVVWQCNGKLPPPAAAAASA